jgi:hypothetical protein
MATYNNEKIEVTNLLVKTLEEIGSHKTYFTENLMALQQHHMMIKEKASKEGIKTQF